MVDEIQGIHLYKVLQIAVRAACYVENEGQQFGTTGVEGCEGRLVETYQGVPQGVVNCV